MLLSTLSLLFPNSHGHRCYLILLKTVFQILLVCCQQSSRRTISSLERCLSKWHFLCMMTYTLNHFVSLLALPARKYTLQCCNVVSASRELARVWRIREGFCTAPGQRGSVLWWHLLANQKGTNLPVGKLTLTFSIPERFGCMMHLTSERGS